MPSLAETLGAQSHGGVAPGVSAMSLRAAMRGETRVLTGQTGGRVYNIPPEWNNRIINVYADGANVFYQLSTGTDAAVDIDAVSVETLNGARYDITAHATNGECYPIPNGGERPIWIPKEAQTIAFRLAAGGTGKIRIHVAET